MNERNDKLANRHDILFLFEVTNGNPNGDPDAGNMPRIDPITNLGIVSDVCLKRKVRNFVDMFPPERNGNGYSLFVKQGNILNDEIKRGVDGAEGGAGASKDKAAVDWLCREFFDIRTFGAVLSTGDLQGSAWGQVRGPAQFTFGRSYHPIMPLEVSITRCAVTKAEDAGKERTMGNKHIVPYALYSAKIYISPAFAERTGFTNADLEVLFEALNHMFEHDRSAARGEMVVRGIYDFEHVGTQHENNGEQNRREARLGCAHAHKLFECVQVELKDGTEFPQSFADYNVNCDWDGENPSFKGVRLHKRHE